MDQHHQQQQNAAATMQQQQPQQPQEKQQPPTVPQTTPATNAMPTPMAMPFQGYQPPHHVSPRGIWISKLTLRIISSISCIIIIGLTASLVNEWSPIPLVDLGPPAVVAFIWNVAEGISIFVRKGRRGIHPGACVGVDLILWLGYLTATLLFGFLGFTIDFSYSDVYPYGYGYGYDGYPQDYPDEIQKAVNVGRAAMAFASLEIALHLALFIIACCETAIRNRNGRQPQIYFIPGPAPLMYQQQQQPGMTQQPFAYPQMYQQMPAGQMPMVMYPPPAHQQQYQQPKSQGQPVARNVAVPATASTSVSPSPVSSPPS